MNNNINTALHSVINITAHNPIKIKGWSIHQVITIQPRSFWNQQAGRQSLDYNTDPLYIAGNHI